MAGNGKKMKILVHGSTGLLGRSLLRVIREAGHTCIGTGLSRVEAMNDSQVFKCDATNKSEVFALVEREKPDVLIHCVAARQPDDCETDEKMSRTMNVETAEIAASALARHGGWMLFVSSDYVFDGKNPPYGANAPTEPLNVYGKHKVEAEERVRYMTPDAGILRLPILYGPTKDPSESSVLAVAQKVKQGHDSSASGASNAPVVNLDNVCMRYPTHTDDVARCLLGLALRKQKHCGFFGVWHFSGDTGLTKFELAKLIGKLMNWSVDHIQPAGGTSDSAAASSGNKRRKIAQRPVDCRLDCGATRLMGLVKTMDLQPTLKKVIEYCFE